MFGLPNSATAYLLHHGSVSYSSVARLSVKRSRSESESEMGVKSLGVDPKPGDLPMARMKLW